MHRALGARPGHLVAFLEGASYPLRAVHFLTKERLWRWALLPAVLAVVVWVGVALLVVTRLGRPLEQLWWAGPPPPLAMAPEAWAVVRILAALVVGPFLLVGTAWASLLLTHALASPAMAALSLRVEARLSGAPVGRLGLGGAVDAAAVAAGNVAMAAVYLPLAHGGLVALWLVPGLGGVALAGAAAMALTQQFLGLPMARRYISYRLRWRVVRERRAFSLGFGSVLLLAWALPLVNVLALPIAVCAGTLAFCDLAARGALVEVGIAVPAVPPAVPAAALPAPRPAPRP